MQADSETGWGKILNWGIEVRVGMLLRVVIMACSIFTLFI